jgi:hypothetical protein
VEDERHNGGRLTTDGSSNRQFLTPRA